MLTLVYLYKKHNKNIAKSHYLLVLVH